MDTPGTHGLNTRGVELPLRDIAHSNSRALVGSEQVLLELLILRHPELIAHLVDEALERRIDQLARELEQDPDRFFREHMLPYQPALFESRPAPAALPAPKSNRGRKKGSTNVTQAYFWEQYRGAVDGPPRMERPYHKTHLAARSEFTYETFCKYLDLFGPPPGYAAPGE